MTKISEDLVCLECGAASDSATALNNPNNPPIDGAMAICLECGNLMAYANDLTTFRELTDDEMHEIAGHPVLLRATEARKHYQKLKQRVKEANEAAKEGDIQHVFMVVSTDENGEGVAATKLDDVMMPLIVSRERLLPMLMKKAEELSKVSGETFRVVRFSKREVVGEFGK